MGHLSGPRSQLSSIAIPVHMRPAIRQSRVRRQHIAVLAPTLPITLEVTQAVQIAIARFRVGTRDGRFTKDHYRQFISDGASGSYRRQAGLTVPAILEHSTRSVVPLASIKQPLPIPHIISPGPSTYRRGRDRELCTARHAHCFRRRNFREQRLEMGFKDFCQGVLLVDEMRVLSGGSLVDEGLQFHGTAEDPGAA